MKYERNLSDHPLNRHISSVLMEKKDHAWFDRFNFSVVDSQVKTLVKSIFSLIGSTLSKWMSRR